jgi:hypothetical protein
MTTINELLKDIQAPPARWTLAELLAWHPDLARRTAQRWISQLINNGQIAVVGTGRSRRYLASTIAVIPVPATERDSFPDYIPLLRKMSRTESSH